MLTKYLEGYMHDTAIEMEKCLLVDSIWKSVKFANVYLIVTLTQKRQGAIEKAV